MIAATFYDAREKRFRTVQGYAIELCNGDLCKRAATESGITVIHPPMLVVDGGSVYYPCDTEKVDIRA